MIRALICAASVFVFVGLLFGWLVSPLAGLIVGGLWGLLTFGVQVINRR